MTTTDYADKIAKLIAKAEDSAVTQEESEVFMAKAQELMTKWSIDEAMLAGQKGESLNIIKTSIVFSGAYRKPHYMLCYFIAESGGCKAILSKGHKDDTLMIVGTQEDIARVEQLNSSLQIQATSALTKWWKSTRDEDYCYSDGNEKTRARREFLHGFASGVNTKLKAAVANVVQESGTGVELVLRDKSQEIDKFISNEFGRLGTSRSRSRRGDYAAKGAGHSAGLAANTTHVTGVSQGSRRELGA